MRNMIRLLILFFCSISSLTIAQQDTFTQKLMSFVKNINTFNRLHPQEKTYLHFDNTGYYVGETIWFKAYVVAAEQNKPTELSRILYVELVSPEGFVVETQKLKIENGQCHGAFLLKDTLYAGYYEVRAYTANMLNFGEDRSAKGLLIWRPLSSVFLNKNDKYGRTWNYGNDDIFSRVLPVYDKPSKEGDYNEKTMRERPRMEEAFEKKKEKSEIIEVSFYPEGGNLINGVTSKIAFKAVNEKGEDLVVNGSIRDSKGEEVTTFNTIHDGTGAFYLCPQEKTYTAKVRYKDKAYTFDLPKSLSSGYVMTLDNLPEDHLLVQIEKSPDMMSQILGLSISCRGRVYFFDTLQVSSNGEPYILKLPKSRFPSGVNQLTLFNAQGDILSDRLFFIDHQEYNRLSFKATKSKAFYQPFEKVDIDFQLKDTIGNPIESDFSLAVRDESTEDITYNTENIQTNLLLSSDLKGFIKDPAYYFASADRQHRLDLDLLLMTQGWLRYSWRQEAGLIGFKNKYEIENGLAIKGSVVSVLTFGRYKENSTFKTEKDVAVNVEWSIDGHFLKDSSFTESNGKYYIPVNDFKGKVDLCLKTFRKGKHDQFLIQQDRVISPEPLFYSFYEISIPNTILATGYKANVQPEIAGQSLSEVTVKAKAHKRNNIDFSHPTICLNYQDVIDLALDTDPIFNFRDFHRIDGPLTLDFWLTNSLGPSLKRFSKLGYSRMLNLENCHEPENVETITVYKDINSREYNMEHGVYDLFEFSDVWGIFGAVDYPIETYISFNSYKNGYSRPRNTPGLRYTTMQGYSYVKDFYSPTYDNASLPKEKDFRRTLYWNPDVKTDSAGKASAHFYNNSTCKSMKISAETLTKGGVPVVCKE